MKTTVLRADERTANKVWREFESLNTKADYLERGIIFKRKELTEYDGLPLKKGSFEIRYTKIIDGVRKGKVIFRLLKKDIGLEIQYDEKFITI